MSKTILIIDDERSNLHKKIKAFGLIDLKVH